MRKFIFHNLLLIMFLVGAASGFFVSNVGWWGLYRNAQDLDRLHEYGSAALTHIYDYEKNALRAGRAARSPTTVRQRRVATKTIAPTAPSTPRIAPTGYDSRMLPMTSVV